MGPRRGGNRPATTFEDQRHRKGVQGVDDLHIVVVVGSNGIEASEAVTDRRIDKGVANPVVVGQNLHRLRNRIVRMGERITISQVECANQLPVVGQAGDTAPHPIAGKIILTIENIIVDAQGVGDEFVVGIGRLGEVVP